MSKCLVKLIVLVWLWFLVLENTMYKNFYASFNSHVAIYFLSPKTLLVVKNPLEVKPSTRPTAPPIPGLSCSPLSNPVLPQKTPGYSAHKTKILSLFIFSALCRPHLTEAVLLKTFEKRRGIMV